MSNEAAASRREADMLRSQLGDAREDAERRLTELRRQYERLMADAERKHAEERAGREMLMEKQFAERLQLLQEQLRTTTEKLLKQRADELDKSNRSQMDSIIAPLKAVMTEMKKVDGRQPRVVHAQHGIARRTDKADACYNGIARR